MENPARWGTGISLKIAIKMHRLPINGCTECGNLENSLDRNYRSKVTLI
jgi:hypothetical protein